MALTKRTLTNWRKEALVANAELIANRNVFPKEEDKIITNDRILLMTQELLDQIMIKETKK